MKQRRMSFFFFSWGLLLDIKGIDKKWEGTPGAKEMAAASSSSSSALAHIIQIYQTFFPFFKNIIRAERTV
jgi:hypothetical protein